MNEALATISAITSSPLPITNAAAPSPPACSSRPSGAPSRQSDIAASANPPPPAASAACSSAESPARTEPVRSAARLSAGNCAAAPTIAALSFSAYGGVEVAKNSVRTLSAPTARSASRAASAAIETLSSSKLATERSPLAAGDAEHLRDRRALEPAVRDIRSV